MVIATFLFFLVIDILLPKVLRIPCKFCGEKFQNYLLLYFFSYTKTEK